MTIKIDGVEFIPTGEEPQAVEISMWYDRHRRNWVLYPVDDQGNQICEARYGFGRKEAERIKAEMEQEYLKGGAI